MPAKKKVLKPRFPKLEDHPTRGKTDAPITKSKTVEDAAFEEVDAPKVAPKTDNPPPPKGEIKLVIDGNNTRIDMGGFNLIDGLTFLKLAHGYLFEELTKAVALNDGKTGASNTTSGSDTQD